jgi:hypothetical protein
MSRPPGVVAQLALSENVFPSDASPQSKENEAEGMPKDSSPVGTRLPPEGVSEAAARWDLADSLEQSVRDVGWIAADHFDRRLPKNCNLCLNGKL